MAPRKKKDAAEAAPSEEAPLKEGRPPRPTVGRFPNKRDLDVYLTQANRYSEQASEASGNLGQHTSQFVEKWKVEKAAATMFRRIARMDRAKGALVWDQLQNMMNVYGLGDTSNLFTGADGEGEIDPAAGAAMDAMTGTDADDDRDVRPGFLRPDADEPPAPPVH